MGCLFVGAFKFLSWCMQINPSGKSLAFCLAWTSNPPPLDGSHSNPYIVIYAKTNLSQVMFLSSGHLIVIPSLIQIIPPHGHWPTLCPNSYILAQNSLLWPFGGPFTFRPLCSFCGLSLPLSLSARRLSLWTLKKGITNMQCSLGNNSTQQCLHFDVYPCPWPSLF